MPNQEYIEEEIDLRECIKVIIKRKRLILSIFLVSVIAAAVASLLMPKVYETSSLIRLGSIDGLLIGKDEAIQMLLSQNNLLTLIKELNLDIKLESLKEKIKIKDIKDTDLLGIKVQFSDPDMAVKINERIPASVFSYGQNFYQKRTTLINERLKELEQEIQNTELDIKRTQNLIMGLSGSTSDIAQSGISLRIILLQNTLPNYENQLTALKNQRNNMKVLLAKADDFKVFDPPVASKYPIAPNIKLNILLAGILSLMLGIFLALFMEYWQQTKKKEVK